MTPKILLIRPEPESHTSAEALEKRGYEAIISPLLEIKPKTSIFIEPADVYLLTSQNGAKVFAEVFQEFETPLYSIGEKTTKELEKASFRNIKTAQGDARDLIKLVQKEASLSQKLVHLSGDVISVDIAKELKQKGYNASRQIIYKTEYLKVLPLNVLKALEKNEIRAVFIYSSKSAKIIVQALKNIELGAIYAICLSDKIAGHVRGLIWADIYVSSQKTTLSLIDQLDQIDFRCHNDAINQENAG